MTFVCLNRRHWRGNVGMRHVSMNFAIVLLCVIQRTDIQEAECAI